LSEPGHGRKVRGTRCPAARFGLVKGGSKCRSSRRGQFRRKGRPGWYVRLYRSGRERWQSLGTDFAQACDRARVDGQA
jgi:hypothetical protein